MFVDIESIEIVDYDMSSLKGLDIIYFNNLKTLKIVGNSFGDLTTDEYKGLFERMPQLETLDLSNNNINAISLKNATNVKNLNLSSNNLSQIDLSNLKSADLDINIANNNFSSIKQIGLPTKTDLINSIKLNIIMNNITDLSEEFVNYSKLTLDIGLQGIVGKTQKVVLTTSDTLTFYKLNKGGVYAKIYKSAVRDTLVRTIKDDVDYTDSDIIIDIHNTKLSPKVTTTEKLRIKDSDIKELEHLEEPVVDYIHSNIISDIMNLGDRIESSFEDTITKITNE